MKKSILALLLMLAPLIVLASGFKSPHKLPKNSPWQKPGRQNWRLQEQIVYYAEPGEEWEPAEKFTLDYDSQNHRRIANIWNYYWDWFSEVWDLNYKISHTYIGNTEYISSSEITSIFSGEEAPFGRTFVAYDDQMRLTSISMEMWDWDIMDWVLWSKVQIVYYSAMEYTVHNWFMGFFAETPEWNKIEFEWDDMGRVIQETEYSSADSLNWILDNKLVRTYHPNDTTTGTDFINNLARYLPLSYYFDANFDFYGMIDTESNYFWIEDFAQREWVPSNRDTYSYDAQDNLIQILSESWTGDAWEPSDRQMLTYDGNNNLIERVESSLNDMDMIWEDSIKTNYAWDTYVSADDNTITPVNSLSIRAYPAPFKNSLNIDIRSKNPEPVKLGIYNLRGQLIQQFMCTPNHSLVWDGTTSSNHIAGAGVYFIKTTQGTNSQVRKVIKTK